jgi:hypothetical protein
MCPVNPGFPEIRNSGEDGALSGDTMRTGNVPVCHRFLTLIRIAMTEP